MIRRNVLFLATLAPAVAQMAVPPGPAQSWEEAGPMMASAAALLSVSGSIPKQMGEPVQELLEEHVIRIDAQGRRTIQYRYIFRIDEASAVDSWSSVSAEWSPWYEARPAVQARVITPDGTVHFLDQKTLGEYGADDPDSNVFGDRKHLRGPLPMLRPGALAEVMTTYRESEPFSQAGVRGRIPLLQNVPVYRTVVQIETPADRPLKTSLTGIPSARPVREERRGLSTLTLTLGPLAARAPQEANLPSDSAQAPSLHYSTATGWGAVALEYAGILDRQLAGEDLAAWVRETVDPAASRAEKISRIVERLHREVRYTGVEFKDAAIVPARPSESLKRGYGDCKDKATLFVCMLREAGIAAEVALLRSGTAPDVDPGTPGLSAFNHAIVFLPGDEPAWIDATADLSSPGKPLHGVEGRWALVAAKSTTGLAKVPELSPGANRYREIRKVRFKEGASGDILETTMAEGWWEDRYRNDFSQMDPKKLRENLEGYATRTFSAKALGAFKHSEPRKLGAPFELELEILGTPQVKMDDTQAVVSMNPWPLVTKLQKVLQEGLGEEKGTARQRQAELQMPEPYLHQLIYQVDVPAGFSVSEPLKGREVHFGPALLTISFRQEGNRRLFAECSMNTGKRRWTAPEVNQALESIRAFGDEKIPQIVMEQVGEQLLAAGKIREAIAEFQRLTLELPGQASPHNRIARAFLAAGLGEAARIEARRAIALDAKSATAQETLGWVLQHDLLGRRFKPGWDFRGALEAYRKAKALDPTRYSIRGDLAILLEYDAEGRRYSPGADLDSSILEYRALSTDLKNHTLDANLVLTLAKRARYQESVDLAKTVPQGVVRDSWLVVGLVRLQGVEGAIEESRRLITDVSSRRTAWTNAADHLLNLRLYPEAARLLMEASNGSDQMSQLRGRSELISRVRRVEPSDKDWRDPAGLVRQFLITVLRQTGEPEQIRSFFSPAVTHFLDQEALTQMLRSAKSVLRGVQLAPEALADVTASLVQIASEGDDSRGYRVQVRGFGEQAHVFFVTPSKGGYRLVGAGDELPFLGVEAAWQLDQGNLALAGAWLDLAREAMPSPPSDDPLAGPGFARFWTKGQYREMAGMRLAASVLVPREAFGKARPILLKVRSGLPPGLQADQLDAALMVMSMLDEDWKEVLRLTERLGAVHAGSKTLEVVRGAALIGAKQWGEAEAHFLRLRTSQPQDPMFREGWYQVLKESGRREVLERELQARVDGGTADAAEFNNLAWNHVVRAVVTEKTLEYIRSSTQGREKNSASMHTLAVILAELGRTREAKEALVQELELKEMGDLGSNEWYVLGRIAEHLGVPDVACLCYDRGVSMASKREKEDEDSCATLATRRLKGLRPA